MIINSYQIKDALQLKPIAPERAGEACQSKDARIWLDLQTAEPDEIEAWLDTLGITGLSRQLCSETRNRSGFYPLKKEIFLVIPVLADVEGLPEVDYLAILCRENLLLTFHRKSIFNPQQLATLDESDNWLPERSIAGLVSAMTIDFSMECLRHIAGLRHAIHVLEEQMDQEPDTVEAEEILDMRADLLVYETVVSDQLPSLQALSATDKSFFKLKDVQDRTNRKLGMLTILSAILRRSVMETS